MAKRFFVDKSNITIIGNNINVIGEEVHHINVLRHKVGDIVTVNEYVIKITNLSKNELVGKVLSIENLADIKNYTLTLYQSYLKSDKMEYVVQKAVELGIDKIVPVLSKNCVVKLDEKDKIKKTERLNRISVEASKQCGRADIVKIEDVLNISSEEFLKALNKYSFVLFAYENSRSSLKEVLKIIQNELSQNAESIDIAVVIGPEGGFDKSDIDILNKLDNICEISLGKNILRAETASLNLISIINYELNEE